MSIKGLGWLPDPPDLRDLVFKSSAPSLDLPRIVDLHKEVPLPILDQGQTSSCVGQATGHAHLYRIVRQGKPLIAPSRLFIYYYSRVAMGAKFAKIDSGCHIRDAFKVLATKGTCDEKLWPFKLSKLKLEPTLEAKTNAETFQATSYRRLDNTNVDDLLRCLAEGNPFVFGMSLYTSFDLAAGTGIVRMPKSSERFTGGHAMICVGYNRDKQLFKVQNSWGARWGAGGFCFVPFEYLANQKLASDFWTLTEIE